MRRLQLTQAHADVASLLRARVDGSVEAAFLHRLHCIVLVGAGLSCARVAAAFGSDPRTVQRWVGRFEASGVDGLHDTAGSGRPARLDDARLRQLRSVLATDPRLSGHALDAWNAEALRLEIERRFGVTHSARHCARLLAALRDAPVASSPTEAA